MKITGNSPMCLLSSSLETLKYLPPCHYSPWFHYFAFILSLFELQCSLQIIISNSVLLQLMILDRSLFVFFVCAFFALALYHGLKLLSFFSKLVSEWIVTLSVIDLKNVFPVITKSLGTPLENGNCMGLPSSFDIWLILLANKWHFEMYAWL